MSDNKNKKNNSKRNVPIKYKKSPSYEIYHADGAMGQWTPKSNLSVDFYVERASMPEMLIHEVSEDGKLGRVIEQRGDKGVSRERQFGVIMSIQTAIELRDWLANKIEEGQQAGLFEIKKDKN
jgi:hypothetical protein